MLDHVVSTMSDKERVFRIPRVPFEDNRAPCSGSAATLPPAAAAA